MKAILVMFDSLNRRYLPAYGADWIDLPNFTRLQRQSVTFDRCYGGSMPCMPARREMHTGRYNFLHRSWGPLEPFDDSVPEILKSKGVYSHLVTDHQHYWEDGGATYHNRFSSYEFFRGQEGDAWKGEVEDPDIPESVSWRQGKLWRQDWINRKHLTRIEDHPQTRTFDAGIEFIDTNHQADNWFLQIECFDPHEPFMSSEKHQERFRDNYAGAHFDWPDYRPVMEDDATVAHARKQYAALLSMCDESLGRVLDAMDEHDLWRDTLLIVCTDHGFLLGERNWWGKNIQPWYDETIHTPLFAWDPRSAIAGERRQSLVQTIDFGPTLLEFFGIERTADMQGRALRAVIESDTPLRQAGLFGSFGSHVGVTDGRYVYMRASTSEANQPLENYTLMPTHMNQRFIPVELKDATLHPPLPFTKQAPVLQLPAHAMGNSFAFGTLLFDLETDPGELTPLDDAALELRMAGLLVEAMRANDAPSSQFARLGLPAEGAVGATHLQVKRQWPQVVTSLAHVERRDEIGDYSAAIAVPVRELATDPWIAELMAEKLGLRFNTGMLDMFGHLTPWHLSRMLPAVPAEKLRAFDAALSAYRAERKAG